MNVLLLGSGGREHALAWKIKQSKKLNNLFIAPGNAGTTQVGQNVSLDILNFDAVKDFVLKNEIDMVVVGSEQPLVEGIHDYFLQTAELKNIPVIGPDKKGALLEGSKDFSKQFMQKYDIPTAKYRSFEANTLEAGYAFLETLKPPFVLKADGLAAGKGVEIIDDLNEAKAALKEMLLNQKFGAASAKVVIEEFLSGIEVSVFVLTDGKSYKILPEAKDYKRVGEGDTGPNTGGMGSVSPVPFADAAFMQKVEERIIKPTLSGLQKENIDYRGFIFIGLMNVDGNPYVIEYNVRMGDPETESVMPRIQSDLLDLFDGVAKQTLDQKELNVDNRTAFCVMLTAKGYPDKYEKGKEMNISAHQALLFHAGTVLQNEKMLTNGGRVLAVTAYGNNLSEAMQNAYADVENIQFEGKSYRRDIGQDLLKFNA